MNNREYLLYFQDILLSMERITEYIENIKFEDFRKNYSFIILAFL